MTRSGRFPSLSHWGAFTAIVRDDRVTACEPFPPDPAPSPMLAAIPAMVHSDLRVARPASNIGEGDLVRVFNDRGACLAGAALDERVREGVAIIATGAWYAPDASGLEIADNPKCFRATSAPRGSRRVRARCRCWSRWSGTAARRRRRLIARGRR
jgi:hypothetical protein